MKNSIVSVVTNKAQYKKLLASNPFLQGCTLRPYDNSQENLPIPTRYNHFIENELPQDGWIVFCHQDFEFLQNPNDILLNLDKNCIYGPIGVRTGIKSAISLTFHSYRWKPSLHKKYEYIFSLKGQIHQNSNDRSYLNGTYITSPQLVDTLDCCCIIIHSSLITKHHLRFDPNFDFHCYTEDLCLAARHLNIQSKAIQIKCCHYSLGNLNEAFWSKYQSLLQKYPSDFFATTCNYNYVTIFEQLLGKRWPSVAKGFMYQNLFQSIKK